MDILKRIEQLCVDNGWTLYKLSLESGLSQSTLANMFTRGTLPSLSTLTSICEAFSISLSDFFKEDDDTDELIRIVKSLPQEKKDALLLILKKDK